MIPHSRNVYSFQLIQLSLMYRFCTAHEAAMQAIGIKFRSGFSQLRLVKRSISLLTNWQAVYELWKERIQHSHLDTTLPSRSF
ncbi:hypothetical protein EUTSA_v10019390mg [Eutrema salsugineum]|uniref:Uncharacterized protein n=1 Tax=Eutrema salsugineum TaxID=72664 RepID=V4KG67_EUTSA|nr:hypothetical protein EUTSA_v10019390mg [Eutrema salsugineum]